MRPLSTPALVSLVLSLTLATLLTTIAVLRARRADLPPAAPSTTAPAPIGLRYTPVAIGEPAAGRPWITHVTIHDLDGDGFLDVLASDAQSNSIRWLRQHPRGVFTESQVGDTILAPAHIAVADINADGRRDLLVAALGQLFPTNERLGAVVALENLGDGRFRTRVLLDQTARVADVRSSDLDGDGRVDLIVGHFGYDQGGIRWLRQVADWRFESHVVNVQSGAIHTPPVDLDGDGRTDFVGLVSQEFEEIHFFRNQGGGQFSDDIIWGSTNEDYGSSGIEIVDVNRDGRADLLYANGDAFDYARPGPRPWHGVQWLENLGAGRFAFHRVGDLPGAYGPVAADLDGNGAVDFVAASGFNDWSKPEAVSLMAWLNDGRENFTPVVLAHRPTHLITVAAGDLDGDGVIELVTGGLHAYPPFEHVSRILVWKRE
ncbi:MAG TPA: VCBS repeat-containing protein [Candidatus Synoicihabitans sp.]|nr:VCBS repeat-containing protein [Candidatus Synoicihabitans sp.]